MQAGKRLTIGYRGSTINLRWRGLSHTVHTLWINMLVLPRVCLTDSVGLERTVVSAGSGQKTISRYQCLIELITITFIRSCLIVPAPEHNHLC